MREVVEIVARVAELERRVTGMVRQGTVAEVDTSGHRVRIKLGESEDGGDLLSPWGPHSQGGGARKGRIPPPPGAQITLIAPTGDWQQAGAMPLTWSNANGSPSQAGDENVVTYGNVRMTLKDDLVEVNVGGSILKITSSEISMTTNGSKIVLNGGGVTVEGSRIDLN